MNIRVKAIYEFTVIGDGMQKEFDLHFSALKAPDPIKDDVIPSGILSVHLKGGADIPSVLDGEILHMTFNIPPSAATVMAEMLFGRA